MKLSFLSLELASFLSLGLVSFLSLGLVFVLLGSAGFGQVPVSAPAAVAAKVDIYANFVGTWIGTSHVVGDGAERTTPVKVEVTEDAKKTHLRFFYTFSAEGQTSFEHVTRVATLDPVKGEMTWEESDHPEALDALRHTAGLAAFARKGYGSFDASYDFGFGSEHLTRRCRYVLDPDLFGYVWSESVDGRPFTKYSVTQLTRDTAALAVLLAP